MSHQDVVEATGVWEHAPFSGDIDEDGNVWGRGTVDTKGSLFCIFTAFEELIADGYEPECDVYIASSCTEEWSGGGAPATVEYLKNNGVKLAYLMDEGGMILEEPVGGVKGVYGMVGVVEKGYGDIKFIARGKGGHASAPTKNTPLVRLGKLMCDIEKRDPFISKLHPTAKEMFRRMTPYMDLPMRMIFANLWLFKPLLLKLMPSISPQGAAMIKTTCAFTTAQGSRGLNVLPQEAYVTANMRFIHHQSTDESIEIMRKKAAKYNVDVEILRADKPQPIVDYKSAQFALVEDAVREVFGNIGVCPYPMTGGTDCKFYTEVTNHAIRFAPIYMNEQQHASIHGLNENISVSARPDAVDFYKAIIKKA